MPKECRAPSVMTIANVSLKQLQIIFENVASTSDKCAAQIGPPISAAVIDDDGFRELKD